MTWTPNSFCASCGLACPGIGDGDADIERRTRERGYPITVCPDCATPHKFVNGRLEVISTKELKAMPDYEQIKALVLRDMKGPYAR